MLQVKLVTPIYYVTKFQGIFISEKMTLWPGDVKQRPLTCVAIAAGNKSLGDKFVIKKYPLINIMQE